MKRVWTPDFSRYEDIQDREVNNYIASGDYVFSPNEAIAVRKNDTGELFHIDGWEYRDAVQEGYSFAGSGMRPGETGNTPEDDNFWEDVQDFGEGVVKGAARAATFGFSAGIERERYGVDLDDEEKAELKKFSIEEGGPGGYGVLAGELGTNIAALWTPGLQGKGAYGIGQSALGLGKLLLFGGKAAGLKGVPGITSVPSLVNQFSRNRAKKVLNNPEGYIAKALAKPGKYAVEGGVDATIMAMGELNAKLKYDVDFFGEDPGWAEFKKAGEYIISNSALGFAGGGLIGALSNIGRGVSKAYDFTTGKEMSIRERERQIQEFANVLTPGDTVGLRNRRFIQGPPDVGPLEVEFVLGNAYDIQLPYLPNGLKNGAFPKSWSISKINPDTMEGVKQEKLFSMEHGGLNLLDSPSVRGGAPVIGKLPGRKMLGPLSPDRELVLSGWGNVLAIRELSQQGRMDDYIAALKRNAKQLGITPEEIDANPAPLLYRRVVGDPSDSDHQYRRLFNYTRKGDKATMSPSELAQSDAGSLIEPHELTGKTWFDEIEMKFNDKGDLIKEDAVFIKMAEAVFSKEDFEALVPMMKTRDKAGKPVSKRKLTRAATHRIRNAWFNIAYDDDFAMKLLTLNKESGTVNFVNSLEAMAPSLANYKRLLSKPKNLMSDFDISQSFTDVAKMVVAGKREGLTLRDVLVSYTAEPERWSEFVLGKEGEALLKHFAATNSSPKGMKKFIDDYIEVVSRFRKEQDKSYDHKRVLEQIEAASHEQIGDADMKRWRGIYENKVKNWKDKKFEEEYGDESIKKMTKEEKARLKAEGLIKEKIPFTVPNRELLEGSDDLWDFKDLVIKQRNNFALRAIGATQSNLMRLLGKENINKKVDNFADALMNTKTIDWGANSEELMVGVKKAKKYWGQKIGAFTGSLTNEMNQKSAQEALPQLSMYVETILRRIDTEVMKPLKGVRSVDGEAAFKRMELEVVQLNKIAGDFPLGMTIREAEDLKRTYQVYFKQWDNSSPTADLVNENLRGVGRIVRQESEHAYERQLKFLKRNYSDYVEQFKEAKQHYGALSMAEGMLEPNALANRLQTIVQPTDIVTGGLSALFSSRGSDMGVGGVAKGVLFGVAGTVISKIARDRGNSTVANILDKLKDNQRSIDVVNSGVRKVKGLAKLVVTPGDREAIGILRVARAGKPFMTVSELEKEQEEATTQIEKLNKPQKKLYPPPEKTPEEKVGSMKAELGRVLEQIDKAGRAGEDTRILQDRLNELEERIEAEQDVEQHLERPQQFKLGDKSSEFIAGDVFSEPDFLYSAIEKVVPPNSELPDDVIHGAQETLSSLVNKIGDTGPVDPFQDTNVFTGRDKPFEHGAFEASKWGRSYMIANNPFVIFSLLHHNKLTQKDVEDFQGMYPEMYIDTRDQLAQSLGEDPTGVPYEKRLSLNYLFGIATDPSLNYLSSTQSIYAKLKEEEPPQSQGGVKRPIGGDISKNISTPTTDRMIG